MRTKLIDFMQRSNPISFTELAARQKIFLYAGDIAQHTRKGPVAFVGLSLSRSDRRHLKHDVRKRIPLPDNSVSIYQSEDVFEHVEYDELLPIVNEIFRVLETGGLFRLSLPDYRCDVLYSRSEKDNDGRIVFDPGGGGAFRDGKVTDGGHLWFPNYESVAAVMRQSEFMKNGEVRFLHYYDTTSTFTDVFKLKKKSK